MRPAKLVETVPDALVAACMQQHALGRMVVRIELDGPGVRHRRPAPVLGGGTAAAEIAPWLGAIGSQFGGAQHEGFRRHEVPDASHRDAVVGPDLGGRDRHSLDEAFELRDRFLVPPLLVEVLGQVRHRVHVIGRHLERAPVASLGGREIADLL